MLKTAKLRDTDFLLRKLHPAKTEIDSRDQANARILQKVPLTPCWCCAFRHSAIRPSHFPVYAIRRLPSLDYRMLLLEILPAGIAFAILQVALRLTEDADLARRLKARDPKAMN